MKCLRPDCTSEVVSPLSHFCPRHSTAELVEVAEATQDWYFTFGFEHAHPNCYVKINGTFRSARAEMFRLYGCKWAFQYDEAKVLSSIERFQMKEIKVDMTDEEFNKWLAEIYTGLVDQDGRETAEETLHVHLPKERASAVMEQLKKLYN